jgi:hypothetical protein
VDPAELRVPLQPFLRQFVDDQTAEGAVSDKAKERSFYFEPLEPYAPYSVRGLVRYGTFGFESRIKNPKSKKAAYNRAADDVEEIPLYFDIWCPPSADFALVSLQSFGVRSCVHLLVNEMQKQFEAINPGYRLHSIKLMGNDSPRSLFADAPVKKLILVRHDAYSDKFSSYRAGKPPTAIDMEVTYKAKRGASLGTLRDMGSSFSENDTGVILFDGGEFDVATAEVMIGNRRRPIGIIGPNSDTGSIDISQSVIYAPSGHPTFDSVKAQSNAIMQDFYQRLIRARG